MFVTFSKAFKFEGKEYKDIEIKVEDLSGADLKRLIADYSRLKRITNPVMKSVTVIAWDDGFDVFVASQMSDQPVEFFEKLPVAEYMSVVGVIQTFFNSSALEAQSN